MLPAFVRSGVCLLPGFACSALVCSGVCVLPAFACSAFVGFRVSRAPLLSVPAFACSRRLRAPGVCVLPAFACSGVCMFRCLSALAFCRSPSGARPFPPPASTKNGERRAALRFRFVPPARMRGGVSGLSVALGEGVDHHARAQLGLEPRRLRRHDVARVGDVDELLHRDGVEREGHGHLAAVDAALQLAQAADASHEVNPLRGAQVLDAQQTVQHQIREHRHVQHADGVVVVVGALLGREAVPVAGQIHREVVQPRRR